MTLITDKVKHFMHRKLNNQYQTNLFSTKQKLFSTPEYLRVTSTHNIDQKIIQTHLNNHHSQNINRRFITVSFP